MRIKLTSKKEREKFWTRWALARVVRPGQIGKMLAKKEREADHDGLTGLLNRKGIIFYSELLSALLRREGKLFSILFVDLDGLKEKNDKYGHKEGDRMIKDASAVLKKTSRSSDIVGRWGGDEFVVVLSLTEELGVRKVGERIFAALPPDISLSIGAASWDGKESVEKLIVRADKAMYVAKSQGKGRLFFLG